MKILHIIDSLHHGGGAETLVAGTIAALPKHKHILVSLSNRVDFQEEIKGAKQYIFSLESKKDIWSVRRRVKKTMLNEQPDIIHAHLPLATFIARISKPKSIPLLFSVHNTLSQSLKGNSNLLFWLEKKLYTAAQTPIFVSNYVKKDYESFTSLKGKSHVLYNYIANAFFKHAKTASYPHTKLKNFVAVGSLTAQKNYPFLIRSFKQLEEQGFALDIYGDGSFNEELQMLIETLNARNVRLMGKSTNIPTVLPRYDAYILASTFEGFGIAPMEAAAIGLPLFLSDISVFREVFQDYANYFDTQSPEALIECLKSIDQDQVMKKTREAQNYSMSFSKKAYLKKIESIYLESALSK